MVRQLSILVGLSLVVFAHFASASQRALDTKSTQDFLMDVEPAGCQPKGMKVDAAGEYLYVAEMCGKKDPATNKRVPTASIYDMRTHKLTRTLITPAGAKHGILANTEVDFSLDDKWALVARAEGDKNSEVFPNFGMISIVDARTQKIVKYVPVKGRGSKIIARRPFVTGDSAKKQIVYIANYFSDDISVLDITNLKDNGNTNGSEHFVGLIKLKTKFQNPASHGYFIAPRGVAFTADGKYAIILATETGSLMVVDAVKHVQIAEVAPIEHSTFQRDVNVRHIVTTLDGKMAYLSHMRGNAVSRISVDKLIAGALAAQKAGHGTLPASFWNDILIPFNTPTGPKKLLVLEHYPKDHPNFANKDWDLAHPNTIVLDPIENRYLYVSHRTTSNKDYTIIDPKIKGKVDVIDTHNGTVIMSLVGGAQPTALEISPNGETLISGGFKDDKLYFYDIKKLLRIYEAK
jgi:DNA-binding beta-propeller fold protein YncE